MRVKTLLAGMVIGALAVTAINKNKNQSKSMLKKGKRLIMKKVDDMLNV
ncbi:MAG: hypothetical protein ACOX3U_03355 [Christensenellales bacterium]|jgi:hypothetical protein